MSERDKCLDLARSAVTERGAAYGKPEELFGRIAARWSLTLGTPVTAKQVALCMIDLKVERVIAGKSPDSWVDICGYAACGYEVDLKRHEVELS